MVALLAATLVLAPAASAGHRFDDVPAGAPFATDIDWLVTNGITSGYSDGTYRPAAPVTRQAMALFLYRFAHPGSGSAPACSRPPFPDVAVDAPACGSISWLVALGVTGGYPDGTFKPAAPVTRQAMALFLYRLAHGQAAAPRCASRPFPDVATSSVSCGAVRWLGEQNITTGYSDGGFHPLTSVTRGAMAAFLHRYHAVLWTGVGVDVSHDKCGTALPVGQSFAIVGVNRGIANQTNPCLADELAWAAGSTGDTAQPRVQLYVNTANPGKALASVWPTSGENRYGTCSGEPSTACAYEYGRALAVADATARGVSRPQDYRWWLDVETENSWESSAAGQQRNVAALEGMVEYFTEIGVAGVGLYSTGYQWNVITGSAVRSDSPLRGLPSWLATGADATAAWRACTLPPLTPGGQVVMTQWIAGGFDRNHSCI
ncbi:S-layer homology domain-containing protein [Blastococcus aurantiacus]|uniref:S-layer homology domain-containing protein n=1 Tax=Blastococcus aurantiacus TaxID=1550231 RepID=UPI00159FE60B|nr:S-layer homology domain-containing protein [Blastococcus aurantiacus]